MRPSEYPTEPGQSRDASAGAALFRALVLGRLPVVRAGVTAVIREEFGAHARILGAGWAEGPRALAAAASARLDLAVIIPDRGAPAVDWRGLALAAPGAAVVLAVAAAELTAQTVSAPVAVHVVPLGAALAGWRDVLRAAVAAARSAPAGGARGLARPARQRMAPAPLRSTRLPLTQRQREVYGMLSLGYSNKDIAERLSLTVGTVKLHVGAVLQALQARNRVELLLRHTRTAAGAADASFGIDGAVLHRPIPLTTEDL